MKMVILHLDGQKRDWKFVLKMEDNGKHVA
jgi:hypothetical protein